MDPRRSSKSLWKSRQQHLPPLLPQRRRNQHQHPLNQRLLQFLQRNPLLLRHRQSLLLQHLSNRLNRLLRSSILLAFMVSRALSSLLNPFHLQNQLRLQQSLRRLHRLNL